MSGHRCSSCFTSAKVFRPPDLAPADDGQQDRDLTDIFGRRREDGAIEDDEIGELPRFDRSGLSVLVRFIGAAQGDRAQNGLARQPASPLKTPS
jgi:hypothetical protein